MNYFLIDYENVGPDGISDLNEAGTGDCVIIFFSDCCKNISLELIESMTSRGVNILSQKVKTGSKNALDFQLSSYLGYLIGNGSVDDSYYIVSNDKGYDVVVDYWKGTNRFADIARRHPIGDPTTMEEIMMVLSTDDEPEQMLYYMNNFKGRQEIHVAMSRYFRDSKKTGAVYRKLMPLLLEKKKA